MILRLVLCFWFLCFFHCVSWAIGTENNTAQLRTISPTVKELSKAKTPLVGYELQEGDNSTKTRSSPEELKRDEREWIPTAEREVAANDDQSRNNKGSGRKTFEMPEILDNGYPQKVFESNSEECFSPLSVKNMLKNILGHVKKHPYVLDLIINELKYESGEKAESSEFQNDPAHDESRSLPKPLLGYKLFDTNNGCPPLIVRFLKQIPKFLLQLRKHPQCLFPIFGYNNKFKVPSTSSDFCESLHIILSPYKIPRPDSRPIHEFVSPTPEVSFESMEPEVQIPFYLQELNKLQQEPEVKPYYIVPQDLTHEQPTFPKYTPKEIITTPEFTSQFEFLPQELIRPQQEKIQADVIEPFEEPIYDRYPEPIYIKQYNQEPTYIEEHKPIYFEQPESIYTEESRPIYLEQPAPFIYEKEEEETKYKIKPIYIEGPKPFYVEQSKSPVETTYITEPEPIYVEEPNPLSEEKFKPVTPVPIYVNKPETIYVQESEFTHFEESKPHVEPINYDSQKPKKYYVEDAKPVYIEKPEFINVIKPEPDIQHIYIEEYKPIYVEKPEVGHVEELNPGIKHILINEPEPIHVQEPKPIAIQEPESIYIDESGSVNKPNYFKEPEVIYNQYPVYFEESTSNYEIESSPTYEEDFNLDAVKEKPKPIYVEHPELIYVEELKPGNKPIVINEPAPVYIENINPISVDEFKHQKPVLIHVQEPKPIVIQEPEPIYIDERRPVNEPNYFEESKLIHNHFEESTSNYDIDSSPIYEKDLSLDGIKGIPKLIYLEHPELVYVEELKPHNKPILVDEPAPIYVQESQSISIQVSEPVYIEETGPVNNPFYFKEPNLIYNQYPGYFNESTSNYGIESSTLYEEDFNLDNVQERPKPIYVEHPEFIYGEELKPLNKPILIHETAPSYVEKLNLISVDESKHRKPLAIHVQDPKPIAIPVPEPIYMDESGLVNKPNYFEESKEIYNQHPAYFEESTHDYKIESSPNLVHVQEPKPIAIQETEPFYIDESGPVNKPNYFEESETIYNQHPVYFEESTYNYKIESSPSYEENFNRDTGKENLKLIYVEQPELNYVEELNSDNKPIIVHKPAPLYVDKLNLISTDESKHHKPVTIPVQEPTPIAIQEPEPIYIDERGLAHKPNYFEDSKAMYNQYPDYFEESTHNYEVESSPTYEDFTLDDVKEKPKTMYVEHPELISVEDLKPGNEPIYLNEPKLIYVEDPKTNNIQIVNSEPTYVNNKQNPIIQMQPAYFEDTISTLEKEYTNEEPKTVVVVKPSYVDKTIFVEKPINDPENVHVEKPEIIYANNIELEPTYVEKELDYIEYPEADIYTKQFLPESISKPQTIEQPEPMYMQEPIPASYEEFNTNFEKPKHIHSQEQDTIYSEGSKLLYNDQLTHVEDSKPVYVEDPEMTYIKKPMSIEQIEAFYMLQTSKDQPTQQVYAQILPSNVVKHIIQLIRDNPKKHINNIKKILEENRQVIKPQLYKIFFSILNALIRGIVDSEKFSEIVNYLIQPRITSDWNNKKTQTLYYLLLPGKTGQVEASILDIIYGLIQQPENTTNNPRMLDLIFPLLKKIKTEHVDHRINDIILALLNRNKNNIFSDKEVEILLTFIQPTKMGYIPKQRIDIAAILVNFDKIPYFSQDNIKTIFLLMIRNKIGRIDPRAIQILERILLPRKFSFLSEQNVMDLLGFLGTNSRESIHPKRLEVALFLLKNKPQAPILIDCFIKNLKDYDIDHSKFIDIILYLHKKDMLAYSLLETLVSLLSQETLGHIDPKTLDNLLLILEPYKNSKPEVVFDVYHILNRETFPTPNEDVSTIDHNIKVLMYYLMNSGTKQFDQSLNQENDQLELKNLLSKVFPKAEWAQNNEFVPESLEHSNGYVELTYLLKEQEHFLYHPVYYVKYNIPMTTFLKNIQDILTSNSELINDPPKLLQKLTLAGNVSEISPNLSGFRKEDILKLTFEEGKLIQTKVLDEKNLNLNDQIKVIQDLNANTSPQEILQQNKINAAKYYITYREKPPNLAGAGSVVHGGNIESMDGRRPIVTSIKKGNLREIETTDKLKSTNKSIIF